MIVNLNIKCYIIIGKKVVMKVTVIKPKEDKKMNIISDLIMLILGIILTLNANKLVTTIFIILGIFISGYGIIKLVNYFKNNNQDSLVIGTIATAIGLLTVLLASILSNAIQIISGIWLIIIGLNKLTTYLTFKINSLNLITAILLILLGIYTIFFENAILMIIGIVLIITAISDIFYSLKK